MKKKIFITGAVREFDSKNPKAFCEGIEQYIKDNLLDKDLEFKVDATETAPGEASIEIPLTTGEEYDDDSVSREIYRIFTGECKNFRAHESLWWGISFGPEWRANWRLMNEDIEAAHKKNTRYYKADRYKSMSIRETGWGFRVRIQFCKKKIQARQYNAALPLVLPNPEHYQGHRRVQMYLPNIVAVVSSYRCLE